jgi:hypothetical protein
VRKGEGGGAREKGNEEGRGEREIGRERERQHHLSFSGQTQKSCCTISEALHWPCCHKDLPR